MSDAEAWPGVSHPGQAATGTLLPGLWFSKIESSCWQGSKLSKLSLLAVYVGVIVLGNSACIEPVQKAVRMCVCLPRREFCSQLVNLPRGLFTANVRQSFGP